MKRRSFLISACVIALVAVLAGCSDAVVYPEIPTGGFITQKGDILEGQSLDSTKFEVTATYMNGATRTLNGVSILDTDTDGIAENGEEIYAVVGNGVETETIYAYGQVTTYPIHKIIVDNGPEAITYANGGYKVTSADFNVSATYVKNGQEQAPVVLSSSEYTIDIDTPEGLTEDNPIVPIVVTVTANLPNNNTAEATFDSTAVYGGATTVLPEGTEVTSIAVEYNASIPGLDYEALPEPDTSKVKVTANGKYDITEAVDLEWTDINGLELLSTDLVGVASIGLTATYEDLSDTVSVYVSPVTVSIQPKDFTAPALIPGEALPAIAGSDFVVNYNYYDNKSAKTIYNRVAGDADGVELVIGQVSSEVSVTSDSIAVTYVTDIEDGKVPAAGNHVAVYPVYMGQAAKTAYIVGTAKNADPAGTITIDEVKLAPDFVIYKQVYTEDINETLTTAVIESISATQDGEEITINPADVKVAYSTSNVSFAKLENGHYLSATNSLYVWITYEYGVDQKAEYAAPVTIKDAVVTDIELVADYQYTTESGQPMLDSTITWSIVYSSADGIVNTIPQASITSVGTVYVDGISGTLPAKVDETAKSVIVAFDDGETNAVTVPVGVGYVDVTSIKAEIADEYVPLFGEAVSTNVNDYVLSGFNVKGDAAKPVITSVKKAVSSQLIQDTNATIKVVVSYVDNTGKQVSDKVLTVESFKGVPYTDGTSIELVYSEDKGFEEIAAGNLYYGKEYNLTKFTWDKEEIKTHGTDSNLKVKGYIKGAYDPETSKLNNMSGNLTDNYAGFYSFVYTYTGTDGKVAEKVFTLTLVDEPKA